MKKVVIVVVVLAFCCSGFAEGLKASKGNSESEAAAMAAQKSAAQATSGSLAATGTCSYNFTSGTNNTFLKYCVTVNGNIPQLMTPFNREHIAVGSAGEGYGVCDNTGAVAYFDYADYGDSGNWGAPTLVSQTATSVKIARTTNDGVWTLTQTITQVAGNQSVRVIMALKNNTGVARSMFLMRFADVDVSGTTSNNFDATANSAFGWNSAFSSTPEYGLMVQNVGNPVGLANTIPFVQKVAFPPNPCVPGAQLAAGPITATDGSMLMYYEGTVPSKGTRTVTMNYKGM
jgi:type II secretory pathway pseudopilin PulG